MKWPWTRISGKQASKSAAVVCLGLGFLLFAWQWEKRLIETPIAVVLTHWESKHAEGPLRYEHVTNVTARFMDADGAEVAQISARGGQPVLAPPAVWLPAGDYKVVITLAIRTPSGATAQRRAERTVTLDGSMTQLDL